MKSSDSHKAVHAHGKRKNLVLSLVFCVAALCVVLLVLVGPGRMLAGAAARSGVETALPASVAAVSDAQPTAAPEQTPAQPETVNINDFGGYPAAGDALGEITISGTSVDCTIYYGDEDPQLDTGAGIYTGGKIPGEGGTILVAGHTATYFRDFEHAQNGAMITVTTAYGTYTYEITDMRVANANDTSAYDMDAPAGKYYPVHLLPAGTGVPDGYALFYLRQVCQRSAAGGAVLSRPGKQAAAARLAVAVQLVGSVCTLLLAVCLALSFTLLREGHFAACLKKSGYLDTVHAAVLDTCSQYAAAIGTTADPLANAITPDAVYAGVMHRTTVCGMAVPTMRPTPLAA